MIKAYIIERMYVSKHLLLQRRIKKNVYDIEIITWIFLELHPLILGVAKASVSIFAVILILTFVFPSLLKVFATHDIFNEMAILTKAISRK